MAEKIKFYFDEHMPRVVANQLTKRDIEVTMAVDVDMVQKDDDTEHLPFATEMQAVLVTRDFPFAGRTAKRIDHAGMVCWTGIDDDYGGMVSRLAELVDAYSAEDVVGQVFWLK